MADVSLQSLFQEARRALDAGDADQAVGIARHVLRHAPDVIEGHRLLGEAYLNAGQTDQALAVFETVLRADPENVPAYYGLGLAQQSLDRRRDAIRSFERALEIQPNLAELRSQLLRLYAETPGSTGQFRLSRAGLGRLYARGQMYGQAIDEFRAVLDAEPDRDDVRVALAEALWRDGQEDEAADWCREVVHRSPELHKPTLILGYLRLAAGQPEGEALWRRAAAQDPSLQAAHSLFDILPPVQVDEPAIPAFDERALREEQERITAEQPVEMAPVAVDSDDDDFFGDSWVGNADTAALPPGEDAAEPPPPPVTAVAAEEPAHVEAVADDQASLDDESLSDDALLASLFGFDDEDSAEADDRATVELFRQDEANDTDTLPASLDEIGVRGSDEDDRPANGGPFSFDDLEAAPEASVQLGQPRDARDTADYKLSSGFEEEHDPDNDAPQPFSFDDLERGAQPFSLDDSLARNDEGDELGGVQAFSLDDWNFEGTAEARPETAMDARVDDVSRSSLDDPAPDTGDRVREDLLVSPGENALDETDAQYGGVAWDEREGRAAAAADPGADEGEEDARFARPMRSHQADVPTTIDATSEASDDDDDDRFFFMDDVARVDAAADEEAGTAQEEVLPFSLSQLGLTDAATTSSAATEDTSGTDQDFEPFSLRDLGVDPGEQGRGEVIGGDEVKPDVQPFVPAELGLDEQAVRAGQQEGDELIEDMTPFSFADLELEEDDRTVGGRADRQALDEPLAGIDEETTPFSLADLGLTDEELARLGLDETAGAPEAEEGSPSFGDTGTPADEELTPFSLADLGLTDEELEDFQVEPEQPMVGDDPARSTATVQTGGVTQPFSLADLGLDDDELAAESVEDVDPQDIFEPAQTIHDADTTPFMVIPTEPQMSAAPPTPEEPVRAAEIGAGGAMFPSGGDESTPDLPPVPAELDRFYQQLEAQPDNHAMRLALARMSEQRHDVDRALEQYRQLIRRGALLEAVIEDLQELASGEHHQPLQRRVHRLLGDAYMKQERYEEAMAEYSWT